MITNTTTQTARVCVHHEQSLGICPDCVVLKVRVEESDACVQERELVVDQRIDRGDNQWAWDCARWWPGALNGTLSQVHDCLSAALRRVEHVASAAWHEPALTENNLGHVLSLPLLSFYLDCGLRCGT